MRERSRDFSQLSRLSGLSLFPFTFYSQTRIPVKLHTRNLSRSRRTSATASLFTAFPSVSRSFSSISRSSASTTLKLVPAGSESYRIAPIPGAPLLENSSISQSPSSSFGQHRISSNVGRRGEACCLPRRSELAVSSVAPSLCPVKSLADDFAIHSLSTPRSLSPAQLKYSGVRIEDVHRD